MILYKTDYYTLYVCYLFISVRKIVSFLYILPSRIINLHKTKLIKQIGENKGDGLKSTDFPTIKVGIRDPSLNIALCRIEENK